MLLYHFGSKDGLLLAVARAVEARTQNASRRSAEDVPGATDALIRQMWAYLADPALGDFERLFFALYGRALQGDAVDPALLRRGHRPLDRRQRGALQPPWACRPTSPGRTPGSGWR